MDAQLCEVFLVLHVFFQDVGHQPGNREFRDFRFFNSPVEEVVGEIYT